MIAQYAYVAVLAALTILSLRTLATLGTVAPWTSAGWIFTLLYDCSASIELLTRKHLPIHLPYVFLVGLIIAFIIAGIRDERQGEPWWWPTARSLTRAERRAS